MTPLRPHLIRSVLLVTVAGVLLTGCFGSGRSAEAFCGSFDDSITQLKDKYSGRMASIQNEDDALLSLLEMTASVAEAQGDLVAMVKKMESKAPDEIKDDVSAIRQVFEEQIKASGKSLDATLKDPMDPTSPLTGMGSAIWSGLANMGSFKRVGEFIQTNCDLSALST